MPIWGAGIFALGIIGFHGASYVHLDNPWLLLLVKNLLLLGNFICSIHGFAALADIMTSYRVSNKAKWILLFAYTLLFSQALVILGIIDYVFRFKVFVLTNEVINRKEVIMKSFQRRWEVLEITIIAVITLLLLIIAYLNWLLAILAAIIVVAVYLINYNTIHNRRRLAREQFSAMTKKCDSSIKLCIAKPPYCNRPC